jgi:hypothetical protein
MKCSYCGNEKGNDFKFNMIMTITSDDSKLTSIGAVCKCGVVNFETRRENTNWKIMENLIQ